MIEQRNELNRLWHLAEQARQDERWADLGSTLEDMAVLAWRIKSLEAVGPLMAQVNGLMSKIIPDRQTSTALAEVLTAPRCNSIEEHNRYPHGRW